jgi:hypothetical protein
MNIPVKTVGFYRRVIEQTQGLRTTAELTKHAFRSRAGAAGFHHYRSRPSHDRSGEPG